MRQRAECAMAQNAPTVLVVRSVDRLVGIRLLQRHLGQCVDGGQSVATTRLSFDCVQLAGQHKISLTTARGPFGGQCSPRVEGTQTQNRIFRALSPPPCRDGAGSP